MSQSKLPPNNQGPEDLQKPSLNEEALRGQHPDNTKKAPELYRIEELQAEFLKALGEGQNILSATLDERPRIPVDEAGTIDQIYGYVASHMISITQVHDIETLWARYRSATTPADKTATKRQLQGTIDAKRMLGFPLTPEEQKLVGPYYSDITIQIFLDLLEDSDVTNTEEIKKFLVDPLFEPTPALFGTVRKLLDAQKWDWDTKELTALFNEVKAKKNLACLILESTNDDETQKTLLVDNPVVLSHAYQILEYLYSPLFIKNIAILSDSRQFVGDLTRNPNPPPQPATEILGYILHPEVHKHIATNKGQEFFKLNPDEQQRIAEDCTKRVEALGKELYIEGFGKLDEASELNQKFVVGIRSDTGQFCFLWDTRCNPHADIFANTEQKLSTEDKPVTIDVRSGGFIMIAPSKDGGIRIKLAGASENFGPYSQPLLKRYQYAIEVALRENLRKEEIDVMILKSKLAR